VVEIVRGSGWAIFKWSRDGNDAKNSSTAKIEVETQDEIAGLYLGGLQMVTALK
jgi:hypothetical protein